MIINFILKIIFLGIIILEFCSIYMTVDYHKYLIQEKRCTNRTIGTIRGYKWFPVSRQHHVMIPKVVYIVNEKEYEVIGPEKLRDMPIYYDKPGIQLVENMLPINKLVYVYYDPNFPRLAFVDSYYNDKINFWLMLVGTIGWTIIGMPLSLVIFSLSIL